MQPSNLSLEELLSVNLNQTKQDSPTTIELKPLEKAIVEVNEFTIQTEIPSFEEMVKKLITRLNYQHLINGSYQKFDKLKEKFPELDEYSPEDLEAIFECVNQCLTEVRELPKYHVVFKKETLIDPQFVAACNSIFDPFNSKSFNVKLREVGLTTAKFNNFLKIKKYKEIYKRLLDRMMDDDLYDASRLALASNVAKGDLPSIKYTHELTNKFTPKADFDPRIIMLLMGSMLDIVTKYVDGNIARKIADELEVVAIKQLGTGQ